MKGLALTYDDIQLVPDFSKIVSRKFIYLNTMVSKNHRIDIPLVASPMDTVCEFQMAKKMAQLGGVGCIHRFLSKDEQSQMISDLRTYFDQNFINLPTMAAIGVGEEGKERANALAKAGVDILIVDVAHGHHENVIRMIDWLKRKHPKIDVIGGNIATASGAIDLEEAGADGLRVGIGGGSLCTTRVKTGFGIPNVTCLEDISKVAKTPIMADGGIKTSGDIAKALAVGAQCVMVGSLIAGTDESPGKILETPSGLYKRYRGSASLETKTTHGQEQRNVEGESTTIPYKGGVKFVIEGLLDGVRSALSYAGAGSLEEYHPEYVQVTNSGAREAQPHLLRS
jgi:IMP dehydrogenase